MDFEAEYERWYDGNCEDRELEQMLRASMAEAWQGASRETRKTILTFSINVRDAGGVPLMLEALTGPDKELASFTAAPCLWVMLDDDIAPREESLSALQECLKNHPELDIYLRTPIKLASETPAPAGAFTALFREWFIRSQRTDEAMRARLSQKAEEAWRSGELAEQLTVLRFIDQTADSSNSDLVLDGLVSADRNLADAAVRAAFGLVHHGFWSAILKERLTTLYESNRKLYSLAGLALGIIAEGEAAPPGG